VLTVDDIRNVEREPSEQEPGTTSVLGGEGWEESDYVEPGGDWSMLADGSWVSPDGLTRSWPLAGPEPHG
jgi:hypothetical protein